MIDPNDIVDLNLLNFEGFVNNGYRQISEEAGVKTRGHKWGQKAYHSVSALLDSYDWSCAKQEYNAQKFVHDVVGIAPKVMKLITAITPLGLKPCIVMQHLNNYIGLEEAYVCGEVLEVEVSRVATELNLRLLQHGYYHGDNHYNNILVRIDDRYRKIVDAYMIDFEYMRRHKLKASNYEEWVAWDTATTMAELNEAIWD